MQPTPGRKRVQQQRTEQQLKRDLDGFVHTAQGFISKLGYELVREKHPHLHLPPHAELPVTLTSEQ